MIPQNAPIAWRSEELLCNLVHIWADLKGAKIDLLYSIVYVFIFLRPTPKTQITRERALQLVSGADFERTCTIFRSGSVPGPPGARRGPRRAENRQKNMWPDLDVYPPLGSRPTGVGLGQSRVSF